jgi:hypothetical protein
VKRLTAWLAGVAGGLAAYRLFKRPAPAAVAPPAPDPAEALRAKLAETKAAPEPEPADPDARRRSVHEQARAAIDEMQGE